MGRSLYPLSSNAGTAVKLPLGGVADNAQLSGPLFKSLNGDVELLAVRVFVGERQAEQHGLPLGAGDRSIHLLNLR